MDSFETGYQTICLRSAHKFVLKNFANLNIKLALQIVKYTVCCNFAVGGT